MTFGPVNIVPEYQCQCYGTILLRHSMEAARKMGVGTILISGSIDFYGRSGFVMASTKGIHYFAETRDAEVSYFLLCELEPGYLAGVTGTYKDPEGYFVDEADMETFDTQFHPRKN